MRAEEATADVPAEAILCAIPGRGRFPRRLRAPRAKLLVATAAGAARGAISVAVLMVWASARWPTVAWPRLILAAQLAAFTLRFSWA